MPINLMGKYVFDYTVPKSILYWVTKIAFNNHIKRERKILVYLR